MTLREHFHCIKQEGKKYQAWFWSSWVELCVSEKAAVTASIWNQIESGEDDTIALSVREPCV